jgi:hypothetical protein
MYWNIKVCWHCSHGSRSMEYMWHTCPDFTSVPTLGKNLFPSIKLSISHTSIGFTLLSKYMKGYNFVVYSRIVQCLHNLTTQFFQMIQLFPYWRWVRRDPARYRNEHCAVTPNLSFQCLGHSVPLCEPSSCSAGSAWSPAPFFNSGSPSGLDWEWPVQVNGWYMHTFNTIP